MPKKSAVSHERIRKSTNGRGGWNGSGSLGRLGKTWRRFVKLRGTDLHLCPSLGEDAAGLLEDGSRWTGRCHDRHGRDARGAGAASRRNHQHRAGQASDTLDPQKTALLVAHEITWQIYNSLIYLDESGKVYPGLAKSWSFSDDHKTVTFKLRPKVKFHDGTPFNAEAVRFTVERHLNPATASPTSWILGPIDHVEVIEELTVAYHYKEPFVALWVGLGYSYCAPISPAAIKKYGDQFGRNPVGTGPFKFIKWEPDRGITLARNDEHDWATPMYTNKGAPYLDGATYVVIPEDATRLAALGSGEVDVISGTDSVPVDKIRQLKRMPGIKVYTRPAVEVYYSYINTKLKPLDDVRVRKAMNYAVDKQKLITLVLDGYGKPAYSPVTSAFSYYNPAVEKIGYDHDPAKAKALMKEAGQEGGFAVDYLVIDNPVYRRIAEVVQQDLAQINIQLKIQTYPVSELFALGPGARPGSFSSTTPTVTRISFSPSSSPVRR